MCLSPSQYKTGEFHAGAVRFHELPAQTKHNRARAEQVCVCVCVCVRVCVCVVFFFFLPLEDAFVQTDQVDELTSHDVS